jgi:hypothetical protein
MINFFGFCSPPSDKGDHSWLCVYTRHIQSAMITYVWKRRTKTKKNNHKQDTTNQLWSPLYMISLFVFALLLQMIVCVLYMISLFVFCSPLSDIGDHSWLCVSCIWRTKTKKVNHIQDAHNQLWWPMSEGREQKSKRLIIYKTHTTS